MAHMVKYIVFYVSSVNFCPFLLFMLLFTHWLVIQVQPGFTEDAQLMQSWFNRLTHLKLDNAFTGSNSSVKLNVKSFGFINTEFIHCQSQLV